MSEQLNAANTQQVINPHTSESVAEQVIVEDEEVEEQEKEKEEVSLPDKK
jgi:hypothetical protein